MAVTAAHLAVIAGFECDQNIASPALDPAKTALVRFATNIDACFTGGQFGHDPADKAERFADLGESYQRARSDIASMLKGQGGGQLIIR